MDANQLNLIEQEARQRQYQILVDMVSQVKKGLDSFFEEQGGNLNAGEQATAERDSSDNTGDSPLQRLRADAYTALLPHNVFPRELNSSEQEQFNRAIAEALDGASKVRGPANRDCTACAIGLTAAAAAVGILPITLVWLAYVPLTVLYNVFFVTRASAQEVADFLSNHLWYTVATASLPACERFNFCS